MYSFLVYMEFNMINKMFAMAEEVTVPQST